MPKRSVIIPIGPSIAYIPLTQGQFALIDREEAPRLSQWSWQAAWSPNTQTFYARRAYREKETGKVKAVPLHREILQPTPDIQVDHENSDTLNNLRSNLRRASHSDNQHNRGLQKNNTSGYKGAYFLRGSWMALIMNSGKSHYLGTFDSPEAAHAAYCEAATRLHGPFVRTM